MKDSNKYSKEVKKLYNALKRRYGKPKKILYDEPTNAVVYAIVSENLTETEAQAAMKKFNSYFVDLNDLRVSRPEEVSELLSQGNPIARNIATSLKDVLMAIFEKYNTVSLETLKKAGKRPAKQVLEKIKSLSSFAVNYCMLTALGSHAIPFTERMKEYLRSNELVHPDADTEQIEGFLTRQISAANAYDFYALLRKESETAKKKKKTALKTKKKTKKMKK